MAQSYSEAGIWAPEFARNGREAALDRLRLHGSLRAHDVVHLTGYSIQTVRKWFRKLVAEGQAWEREDSDRIVDNPRRP